MTTAEGHEPRITATATAYAIRCSCGWKHAALLNGYSRLQSSRRARGVWVNHVTETEEENY